MRLWRLVIFQRRVQVLLFTFGYWSTSHSDIEIAADRGKLGVRICAQYHVVSLSSACPPRGRRPSTGLDELACSERLQQCSLLVWSCS